MPLKPNNVAPHDRDKVIPLDSDDPQHAAMLDDLQGNILKGHGRHHTAHIFIKFGKDPTQARKWVKKFSEGVTTAFNQRTVALARQKALDSGANWEETTFRGFVLSAKGYQALGFKNDQIPSDPKFRKGMKASRQDLNDRPSQEWDKPYRDEIHAMIILAHKNEALLKVESRELRDDIEKTKGALKEIATEEGRVLPLDKNGKIVEHFGYVDGLSQPLFLQEDIESQKRKEGIDQYDPSTPLSSVLIEDPNGGKESESYGSYFVFRKLEQNVKGFKDAEAQLAEVLKLEDEEAERAGALVVGRFEDGTPITLQKSDGMDDPAFNNFNYQNDRNGSKCPFQGHIRKVNPREQSPEERGHRIARRGITYGKRREDMADRPEDGVGLLFMCFQADIANQFERLQQMANATSGGLDPIIGQTDDKKIPLPQQWPCEWAGENRKTQSFDFQGFVTLKGGEYFFAPSIRFLKSIGEGEQSELAKNESRKPKK